MLENKEISEAHLIKEMNRTLNEQENSVELKHVNPNSHLFKHTVESGHPVLDMNDYKIKDNFAIKRFNNKHLCIY